MLIVAIQMDPIERIDIGADSTFALALEAQKRGHQLLYYGTRELTLRDYILRVEVPCEVRWAAVLKPGSLAAAGHVLIVISEACGARIKMRMFDDPQHAMRWIRREID